MMAENVKCRMQNVKLKWEWEMKNLRWYLPYEGGECKM